MAGGGWASFIQSSVSPITAVGSGKADSSSLMDLGKMMADKRQKDRYFNLEKSQYDEKARSEALGRLQAALQNPDDKQELQMAIGQAAQHGISVDGLDNLLAAETERTQAQQALNEGSGETQGGAVAPTGGTTSAPTTPGKPDAPKWLSDYMAGQNGAPGEAATEGAEETPEHAADQLEALENPGAVPIRGAGTLPGDQLKPSKRGDVVIRVGNTPYAKLSVDDINGYRAKQAALVSHVFQPLVDKAADDTETRAAQIAQQQAVEAYNAGMSKDKAIEVGQRAWNQLIGMRFKRDYTKFPPGWKPAVPGGGGVLMSDKQANALWDKMQDNDKQWISEARQQFATTYARKATAQAQYIAAAGQADTPLAQNQGLLQILHEISGAAVTDHEAARFFEGTDISTRIQNLERRIAGGDQSPEMRDAVAEIAQMMLNRSKSLIDQAGSFVEQRVMTDYRSPETDEERIYHAKAQRALFTGEPVEAKKQNRKTGSLEPVGGGTSASAPAPTPGHRSAKGAAAAAKLGLP